MDRAMQLALERCPKSDDVVEEARREIKREIFCQGYAAAKNSLALTWEDVKEIVEIADSMVTGTAWDDIDWPDEQKYYEEVLTRFNAKRNEKEI